MGYNSHNSTGPNATTQFSPSGAQLAPSVRLSLDPICLPFGSIQISVGYRLSNDVPLEYGRAASSDMTHKGQIQFGAMLRFDLIKNLDFGVGVDGRNDWMYVPKKEGTETEDSTMRPWLRANARYLFDKGTNVTPFVGLEAGFAPTSLDINPVNHYRDYAINTGDFMLGNLSSLAKSPESFTRGHFPVWEVAIVGGIRFGRTGNCSSAPTPKPPAATLSTKPTPAAAAPVAVPVRTDDEAAKRAQAEEDARREAERRAAEEAAAVALIDRIKQEGFKSLMVHFETRQFELTTETRQAIAKWVNDVWNNGQYSKAFDQRRLYIIANCDERNEPVNQKLSDDRATALANYMRAEFNINVSRQKGYSNHRPIARGTTATVYAKNRYAQLILDENDILNTGFKINVHIEGPLVGVGK
jgi:outer membrane protein OmpA-like peptidoglycan-associated protein